MAHRSIRVDLALASWFARPRPSLMLRLRSSPAMRVCRRSRPPWGCSAACEWCAGCGGARRGLAWLRLGAIVAWSVPLWLPWLRQRLLLPGMFASFTLLCVLPPLLPLNAMASISLVCWLCQYTSTCSSAVVLCCVHGRPMLLLWLLLCD
jgi:hypothetical protein